jgi:hypothetical protein
MLNDNKRSDLINALTLALQKYEKQTITVDSVINRRLLGLCEVLSGLSTENLDLVPLFMERYKKSFPNEAIEEGFYFKYNVATVTTNKRYEWVDSCPTRTQTGTDLNLWNEPRFNFLKEWIDELICHADLLIEISDEIDKLNNLLK